MSRTALIVIDLQNDYFPGGAYPLWQPDRVLNATIAAVQRAKALEMPVILVQHIAESPAPFFSLGSRGADLHPRLLAVAEGVLLVVKAHADAFHRTDLAALLADMNIDTLLVCGMMTQNCVTHTVLSKQAEAYDITILGDCCTTVDEMLHKIALRAVSTRIPVQDSTVALS